MGKSPSSATLVARWERGVTVPSFTNVWKYLYAIEANFSDLDRELRPLPKDGSRLADIARQLKIFSRERGAGPRSSKSRLR